MIGPVKNDRGSNIYRSIPMLHKTYIPIYATTMGEVKTLEPCLIHIL